MANSSIDLSFLIDQLQQLRDWDIFEYPWSGVNITCASEGEGRDLDLSIRREDITDQQLRRLKGLFGPFTFHDSCNSGRNARGSFILNTRLYKSSQFSFESDESYENREPVQVQDRINLVVQQAYACKKLNPEELTDADLRTLVQNIRAGVVIASSCTPVEGKALEAFEPGDGYSEEDFEPDSEPSDEREPSTDSTPDDVPF